VRNLSSGIMRGGNSGSDMESVLCDCSCQHTVCGSSKKVAAPAYTPLVARIAATDRLIDEVVYRLYGLTEEEIKVVEG
jgi:hypothetical protein